MKVQHKDVQAHSLIDTATLEVSFSILLFKSGKFRRTFVFFSDRNTFQIFDAISVYNLKGLLGQRNSVF